MIQLLPELYRNHFGHFSTYFITFFCMYHIPSGYLYTLISRFHSFMVARLLYGIYEELIINYMEMNIKTQKL